MVVKNTKKNSRKQRNVRSTRKLLQIKTKRLSKNVKRGKTLINRKTNLSGGGSNTTIYANNPRGYNPMNSDSTFDYLDTKTGIEYKITFTPISEVISSSQLKTTKTKNAIKNTRQIHKIDGFHVRSNIKPNSDIIKIIHDRQNQIDKKKGQYITLNNPSHNSKTVMANKNRYGEYMEVKGNNNTQYVDMSNADPVKINNSNTSNEIHPFLGHNPNQTENYLEIMRSKKNNPNKSVPDSVNNDPAYQVPNRYVNNEDAEGLYTDLNTFQSKSKKTSSANFSRVPESKYMNVSASKGAPDSNYMNVSASKGAPGSNYMNVSASKGAPSSYMNVSASKGQATNSRKTSKNTHYGNIFFNKNGKPVTINKPENVYDEAADSENPYYEIPEDPYTEIPENPYSEIPKIPKTLHTYEEPVSIKKKQKNNTSVNATITLLKDEIIKLKNKLKIDSDPDMYQHRTIDAKSQIKIDSLTQEIKDKELELSRLQK
jgi:hypothetical protein